MSVVLPDPGAPNADFERLVVGHHKLVREEEAMRRIREYSLPREFRRMQDVGYAGSLLAKILVIHREPRGRIRVILVPETLGF